MDSPIFGSQKSHHNSKCKKAVQYAAYTSDIDTQEWYLSNKNNSNAINSQVSQDLKLAYILLTVEKNLKALQAKINKCINKKKFQAFHRIKHQALKAPAYYEKGSRQMHKPNIETITNPQNRPLAIVCMGKVCQKLQTMFKVINHLKFKKIVKAWSMLYIMSQKHHLPVILNQYSSCIESDLGICSQIQSKKQINSKKHAKQMKQNSKINQTLSDFQTENEKLAQEIISEQKIIDKFAQQMNTLLAYHESKFALQSDRETWLSDNGISHSSFQNNIKPSQGQKSQPNRKK